MDEVGHIVMDENAARPVLSELEDRKPDVNNDDSKSGSGGSGRRAYRACAHCRSRKAKCDLGDIDAPREPPCSRCKRESRECTFLPSRRGGNLSGKRTAGDELEPSTSSSSSRFPYDADDDGQQQHKRRRSSVSQAGDSELGGSYDYGAGPGELTAWREEDDRNRAHPRRLSGAPPFVDPTPLYDSLYHSAYPSGPHPQPVDPPSHTANARSSQTSALLTSPLKPPARPLAHLQQPRDPFAPSAANTSVDHRQSINQPRSRVPGSVVEQSPSPRLAAPVHPRPLQPPPPPVHAKPKSHRPAAVAHDPESFVTAGMANEADALSLLALTATGTGSRAGGAGSGKSPGSEHVATPSTGRSVGASSARPPSVDGAAVVDVGVDSPKGDSEDEEAEVVPPLAEFDLIREKVLTKPLLVKYVDQFFQRHHQLFPMVPSFRIPKTEAQLAQFAWKDKELLTTMVVIASRFDQEHKSVHEDAWKVMSRYISDIVVHGQEAQVGFVEACLLLSENLPRQNENDVLPMPNNSRPWDDSAQSWHLVGHAVRTGYYLGLDQQTLYVDPKMPTTPQLDRERLAWTYCYLFDRHISLRLGKAFWSRGPGLCFTPNDAQANFPSLRPIKGEQDDFASVVQALIELTQSMTNSHDVLYPSKDRTISLVRAGEYYRYLDEFTRSINAFRDLWTPVKFSTFPTHEIVWCTYQYLRLYIYSFAFQAHVQRAAALGADTHSGGGALFPRGLTQSPDAKFIFESIDSARQLLELCTDRLHPGGALPYLPNRVILWFTFASVFLLKAIYSGAVLQADTKSIIELIQKVIFCLGASSPDRGHIGIRHALLLRTVAKKLRQSFSDDAWVSHTGTVSPIINFPGSPRPQSHPAQPPPTSTSNLHPGASASSSSANFFPSPVQPTTHFNHSWPDYSHASANAHATSHQPLPPNISNPFDFNLGVEFSGAGGATPFDGGGGGGAGGSGSGIGWPGEFGDLLLGSGGGFPSSSGGGGGEGGDGGGGGGGGMVSEDFFSLSNSDFWANLAVPGSGLPFR